MNLHHCPAKINELTLAPCTVKASLVKTWAPNKRTFTKIRPLVKESGGRRLPSLEDWPLRLGRAAEVLQNREI